MTSNVQRIIAVVSDYDRTLTNDALILFKPAIVALELLKTRHDIKIIIASGRQLGFLLNELGTLRLVDAFVAENGGVIYLTGSSTTITLGGDMSRIKAAFRSSSIPVEEGQVILSTKRAFEEEVNRLVRERTLKVHIQYNRDSLMILPSGVDKAVGVKQAMSKLGLSQGQLVCIGDGENDLSLFEIAGIRVATENATSQVKNKANIVCRGLAGVGVARFLNDLLKTMCKLGPSS